MNTRRQAPPPRVRKVEDAPLADMVSTTVETPEGPKKALVVAGTEPLPEPGVAREDELKRRNEDLTARLEALEAAMGIDSSGTSKPLPEQKVDRDIARVYDHTRVINPTPGYAYYWANERAAHGIDVTIHKTNKFEVVCGDMPENPDDRDVRGYRVVGDTILMRIPMELYEKWWAQQRALREHRLGSVDSSLMEMGNRMRGRINVTELNQFQLDRLARRAQAEQTAGAITEARLRSGGIPGLTPGR